MLMYVELYLSVRIGHATSAGDGYYECQTHVGFMLLSKTCNVLACVSLALVKVREPGDSPLTRSRESVLAK